MRRTMVSVAGVAVLLGLAGVAAGRTPRAADAVLATPLPAPAQSDADRPLAVELHQRFTIGGEADDRVALSTVYPNQVAAGPDGYLYMVDLTDNRILAFDSQGRLARALGRSGHGPGEFAGPSAIGVSRDGDVWVYDYGKRALVGFDPEGAILPPVSLRGFSVAGIHALDRTHFVVAGSLATATDSVTLRLMAPDQVTTLASHAVPAPRAFPGAKRCGLLGHEERPVFTPALRWNALGDTTVVQFGDAFVIQVFEGRRRVRTLWRRLEPQHATARLAERYMANGWKVTVGDQPTCTVPGSELVKQVGFLPTIPAYERLLLRPGGTVWAMRTPFPGDSLRADVFSLQSGYIGTATLGALNPLVFMANGCLVSLGRDGADVPVITVFDVKIKPQPSGL